MQFEVWAALTWVGIPAVPYLVEGMRSPDVQVRTIAEQLIRQIGGEPAVTAAGAIAGLPASAAPADPVVRVEEATEPYDRDRGGRRGAAGRGRTRRRRVRRGRDRAVCRRVGAARPARMRPAAVALCNGADPKAWEALVEADVRWDELVARLTDTALAKLCRLGDVPSMGAGVAGEVIQRLRDVPGEHAVEVFRAPSFTRAPACGASPGGRWTTAARRRRATTNAASVRWTTATGTRSRISASPGSPNCSSPNSAARTATSWRRRGREAREPQGRVRGRAAAGGPVGPGGAGAGAAVVSLAQLKDARAVGPLILRLRDADAWVRCRAADALGISATSGRSGRWPSRRGTWTSRSGGPRRGALAKVGGGRVVGPLGEALRDADVEVRRVAAAALAEVSTGEADSLLAAAISDEDDQVRAAAAKGLGRVSDTGGEDEGEEDENEYQGGRGLSRADRIASAGRVAPADRGASGAGSGAEAALVSALFGPGRAGRKAAADALRLRGWEPADDEQRAALSVAAENPLGAEEFGEAAVKPLCLALSDGGHYYLSQTAAECLGRILDPAAVPALCQALKDSTDLTVRGAVATALGASATRNPPRPWPGRCGTRPSRGSAPTWLRRSPK